MFWELLELLLVHDKILEQNWSAISKMHIVMGLELH